MRTSVICTTILKYCCGCVHWQEVEGDSQNINDNYSLHLLVVMSIPFYINRIRIQFFQTASIAIASIILKLVFTNTSFFIISSKTNLPHLLGLSKQLQLCSQANDLVWAVWLFFTMEQTSKHYEACQECPQGQEAPSHKLSNRWSKWTQKDNGEPLIDISTFKSVNRVFVVFRIMHVWWK